MVLVLCPDWSMQMTRIMPVLLLAVLAANAETPKKLSGFFGFPWNTTRVAIEKRMDDIHRKFPQCALKIPEFDSSNLIYERVEFGGRISDNVLFTFFQNRLCLGSVRFSEKESDDIVVTFGKLRESLAEKYGEPDTEDVFSAGWVFRDSSNIYLRLGTNDNSVDITYTEQTTFGRLLRETERKSKVDF